MVGMDWVQVNEMLEGIEKFCREQGERKCDNFWKEPRSRNTFTSCVTPEETKRKNQTIAAATSPDLVMTNILSPICTPNYIARNLDEAFDFDAMAKLLGENVL
jgi:hypothetical protein